MNVLQARARKRLRRRVYRQSLHAEIKPDVAERIMLDDAACDAVLAKIDASKDAGDGGLLDFIMSIDWMKLLQIILAVLPLFMETAEDDE